MFLISPTGKTVPIISVDLYKIKFLHNGTPFTIYIDFIIEAFKHFRGRKKVTVNEVEDFRNKIYKGKQPRAHCNYMFSLMIISKLFDIPFKGSGKKGDPFYIEM